LSGLRLDSDLQDTLTLEMMMNSFVMIMILFGRTSVETATIPFDSQLTCENAKTQIIEMYDQHKIGNVPIILCLRK